VSKRGRFIAYGFAVILIAVGAAGAAAVAGVTGQILAMALIGSGLVILTGLVFMEVGLSEDRERERDLRRSSPPAPVPRRRLEPTRPPRLRGHRHER
jgi:cytochrome c biogenesis protein CcdA